jgi:hypothetical protein
MEALAMAAFMVLSDDSDDGHSVEDMLHSNDEGPSFDARPLLCGKKRSVHPTPHADDGMNGPDRKKSKKKVTKSSNPRGTKAVKKKTKATKVTAVKTKATKVTAVKKPAKTKKKRKSTKACEGNSDSDNDSRTGTVRRKPYPSSQLCRHPQGCSKIILSKGLCFAHGGGRRCTMDG